MERCTYVSKKRSTLLPVDAVIAHIFSRISKNKAKSFSQINRLLNEQAYTGTKIEVWDDLWFWGFITQKGSTVRKLGFNESKYWALSHVSKTEKQINEVKELCDKFVEIIKS